METANTVVRSILQEILVQGSEQAIKGVDAQDAILYMNRWMAEQAAMGISLGYTEVTSLSDPITIANGAINGVVYNVALNLVSSYDITPNARLDTNARNGLKAMRKIARVPQVTKHPSTLPIGGANEHDFSFDRDHFFPGEEDSILTEQNGSILVENNTEPT